MLWYCKGVILCQYYKNYGMVTSDQMKIRLLPMKRELVSLIANHNETLSPSLKDNDLDVFEKYVDCFTEYASLIEC